MYKRISVMLIVLLMMFSSISFVLCCSSGASAVAINSDKNMDCVDSCPLTNDSVVVLYHERTTDKLNFRIYSTNGIILLPDVTVASGLGTDFNNYGASVCALDSTHIVIGYEDLTGTDVTFAIYSSNGSLLAGPIDVDTTITTGSAVSVSAFDSTKFVIGWEDSSSPSCVFAIYNSTGSQLVAPTTVDAAISSAAVSLSVSVSCFNATRFVVSWFDRVDEDVTFAIYNSTGSLVAGPTDVDTTAGPYCFSTFVSCLNETAFVITWMDYADTDTTFAIYNSTGSQLVAPTDYDTTADSSTVSLSAIDDDRFVMVWYDKTDFAIYYCVYNADGTVIKTTTAVYDTDSYLYQNKVFGVCGYEAGTGIGLNGNRFSIQYSESTTISKLFVYNPDGSVWDGYEYPYESSDPSLIYSDSDRYLIVPVIAKADNGDLVVIFRNSTQHNPASGTVDMIRSTDGGLTWNYEGTAFDYLADEGPHTMVNFNGKLVTVCAYGTPHTSIVVTSDDNGTTWSNEGTLNDLTTGEPASTTLYVISEFEIVNDTLYGIGYSIDASVNFHSFLVSSTDGVHYDYVATIGSAYETNEPAVMYLGGSTFLAILRGSDDATTYKAISTDMGETWAVTDITAALGGHVWQCPKLEWVDTNTIIMIGRNLETETLNFAISDDNGTTWSSSQLIQAYRHATSWNGGYADLEANASGNGTLMVVYYSNAVPSNIDYPDIWASWIEGSSFYDIGGPIPYDEPVEIGFTSTPTTTAVNGTTYSYDADVNVSGAVFWLIAGPSWLSINATTGVVSGIPDAVGSATITIRATVNGTTADQTYALTVSEGLISPSLMNGLIEMIIAAMLLMAMVSMIGMVKVKKR